MLIEGDQEGRRLQFRHAAVEQRRPQRTRFDIARSSPASIWRIRVA
jgi:hypothetical protein